MRKNVDTSLVWQHYGHLYRDDGGKCVDDHAYYCMDCLSEEKRKQLETKNGHLTNIHHVSLGTSTGNMKVHLSKSHNIEVDTDVVREQQTNIIDNWLSPNQQSASGTYEVNRELILWFCSDLHPFSMVEDKGMKRFFEKNTKLTLPDPSTLSKAPLVDMYNALKQKVVAELSSHDSVCIMFDGWTDKYNRTPFMGLRVCVMSENWEMKVFTLSCAPLERHDAVSVKDHVKAIMAQFFERRFGDLRVHSVHDGAANMFAASKELGITDPQHCLAHCLHLLLMTDAIENCQGVHALIVKVKGVVKALHFKCWTLTEEMLNVADSELFQQLRNVEDIKELLDLDERVSSIDDDDESNHGHKTRKMSMPTRWNSVFTMLESMKVLKDPATHLLKKVDDMICSSTLMTGTC